MEVLLALSIPVGVVIILYLWRRAMDIEYDGGTELVAALLSFDIIVVLGAIPEVHHVAHPTFKDKLQLYFVLLTIFCLLMTQVSLLFERALQRIRRSGTHLLDWRSRLLVAASYVPALATVSLHIPPFRDISVITSLFLRT